MRHFVNRKEPHILYLNQWGCFPWVVSHCKLLQCTPGLIWAVLYVDRYQEASCGTFKWVGDLKYCSELGEDDFPSHKNSELGEDDFPSHKSFGCFPWVVSHCKLLQCTPGLTWAVLYVNRYQQPSCGTFKWVGDLKYCSELGEDDFPSHKSLGQFAQIIQNVSSCGILLWSS